MNILALFDALLLSVASESFLELAGDFDSASPSRRPAAGPRERNTHYCERNYRMRSLQNWGNLIFQSFRRDLAQTFQQRLINVSLVNLAVLFAGVRTFTFY
jgi:hypothetical protein